MESCRLYQGVRFEESEFETGVLRWYSGDNTDWNMLEFGAWRGQATGGESRYSEWKDLIFDSGVLLLIAKSVLLSINTPKASKLKAKLMGNLIRIFY